MIFKRELAEIQNAKSDFESAAKTLESIKLEQCTATEKVTIWLQIADNWLAADDSVNAEKFINNCAHIIRDVPSQSDKEKTLHVEFKICQAMISDSKRKFNLAAWDFYRLSNNPDLDDESKIL